MIWSSHRNSNREGKSQIEGKYKETSLKMLGNYELLQRAVQQTETAPINCYHMLYNRQRQRHLIVATCCTTDRDSAN